MAAPGSASEVAPDSAASRVCPLAGRHGSLLASRKVATRRCPASGSIAGAPSAPPQWSAAGHRARSDAATTDDRRQRVGGSQEPRATVVEAPTSPWTSPRLIDGTEQSHWKQRWRSMGFHPVIPPPSDRLTVSVDAATAPPLRDIAAGSVVCTTPHHLDHAADHLDRAADQHDQHHHLDRVTSAVDEPVDGPVSGTVTGWTTTSVGSSTAEHASRVGAPAWMTILDAVVSGRATDASGSAHVSRAVPAAAGASETSSAAPRHARPPGRGSCEIRGRISGPRNEVEPARRPVQSAGDAGERRGGSPRGARGVGRRTGARRPRSRRAGGWRCRRP